MNTKLLLVLGIFGFALLAIPLTVYLVSQQQEVRTQAQNAPCTTPPTVGNVRIEYPSCVGNNCNLDQASCSWDAVSGAASYNVRVTDVTTGAVVKTESASASTTKTVFSIVQGNTYRCDVAAVNSCGATGGTGTDTQVCKNENVPTPTTVATTTNPTTPPAVSTAPSPTVIVSKGCFYTPCNTTDAICQTGTVCITAKNGSAYCAIPSYQQACQDSPSYASCCTAPLVTRAPQPSIAQPGSSTSTLLLGIGAAAISVIGGMLFMKSL